jgi:hypothetical protein
MDKTRTAILGMVGVACATILFPVAGYTATETPKVVIKTVPVSTTASKIPAQTKTSDAFSRAVEAGKKVASRALSSKAKEDAEAPVATATPKTAGKVAATATSVTGKAAAKGVGAVPAKGAPAAQKKLVGLEGSGDSPAVSPDKKGKYVFEYPDQPVLDETMGPVEKKIEGEVGMVIKMGMNVEFDRNSKTRSSSDLWINFAKGVELEGVKSFGEFRDGDKVQVSYTESKDGSKRVIESIKMLKAKTDEERKMEALAAEAEAKALAAEKAAKNVSLEAES